MFQPCTRCMVTPFWSDQLVTVAARHAVPLPVSSPLGLHGQMAANLMKSLDTKGRMSKLCRDPSYVRMSRVRNAAPSVALVDAYQPQQPITTRTVGELSAGWHVAPGVARWDDRASSGR